MLKKTVLTLLPLFMAIIYAIGTNTATDTSFINNLNIRAFELISNMDSSGIVFAKEALKNRRKRDIRGGKPMPTPILAYTIATRVCSTAP